MRTTQKREEVIARIRTAARKLYLSGALGDLCESSGTLQQMQFILEALEQELGIREENTRKRLIRRACFPAVKSFTGYDYSHVTIPPAMPRTDLESRDVYQQSAEPCTVWSGWHWEDPHGGRCWNGSMLQGIQNQVLYRYRFNSGIVSGEAGWDFTPSPERTGLSGSFDPG